MITFDCEQGSPEWHAVRCGKFTASEFDKVITPAKLGPSTQLDSYLNTLAAEWLLGQPIRKWEGSFWTERGTSLEPEARLAFSVATGYHVHPVGFVLRGEDSLVGASPDALVLDQPVDADNPSRYACGVLELKCPRLDTHLGYWRNVREGGGVPTAYRLQVQGQMWVAGLSRAWFQSYYPEDPDHPVPEVLVEVGRDDAVHDALSEHVPAAVSRLRELCANLSVLGCTPRDPQDWAAEQELEAGGWEGGR